MKQTRVLVAVALVASVFTACTKNGDTINNYVTGSEQAAPPKKVLKELTLGDTSSRYVLSYYNNDPDKLQELVLINASVPSAKLIVQYSSTGKAESYQVYTLPANTLSSQGTFKTNNKGNIIEAVSRQTNGDTTSIMYMQYNGASWQPSAFNLYSKSDDRITTTAALNYDGAGNLTNMTIYSNNGSGMYLSSEVTSNFSKAINPMPRAYNLWLLQSLVSSATPVYISNYVPYVISQKQYKQDGSIDNTYVSSYYSDVDADGHAVNLKDASGTVVATFKY